MKYCSKCGEAKPTSDFHKNKASRDGLCTYCKPCWNEYCKYRWETDRNNPARLRVRRNRHLEVKYGLDIDTYEALLATQGGGCAVCGKTPEDATPGWPESRLGPVLAVDHNHACCPGKKTCGACVRGLVCSPCNRAIGYLEKFGVKHMATYLGWFK
jgi:hypothetical protein